MRTLIAVVFSVLTCTVHAQGLSPTYVPGEQWLYSIKAIGPVTRARLTVMSVTPNAIEIGFGPPPSFRKKEQFSPAMNMFDPAGREIVRIRHPLKVGDSWDSEFEWVSSGIKGKTTLTRKVVARERVRVADIEMDAFKIVGTGYWTDYEVSAGAMTETYWYAPEVKNIVRLQARAYSNGAGPSVTVKTLDDDYELLRYSPAP